MLGFTVVTGNGWRNEEVAHLLRLEEIASRTDVPVIPEQRPWEHAYEPHKDDLSPPIPEGLPTVQPTQES